MRQHGGEIFFARADWRSELGKLHLKLLEHCEPAFQNETQEEVEAAVRKEMAEWKKLLEDRLGKEIDYLCYPWYQGSPLNDWISVEFGYRAVYYGLEYEENKNALPYQVRRISEEYLHCLPGRSRYLQVFLLVEGF